MWNTFWFGIQGEKNRRSSLLCHNQSVFPHAFYSWFLPFRLSFFSSLFFWFLVHCLTDGFGTMFWQQLVNKKKRPLQIKIQFFLAHFITQITHSSFDTILVLKILAQITFNFINRMFTQKERKKRTENIQKAEWSKSQKRIKIDTTILTWSLSVHCSVQMSVIRFRACLAISSKNMLHKERLRSPIWCRC